VRIHSLPIHELQLLPELRLARPITFREQFLVRRLERFDVSGNNSSSTLGVVPWATSSALTSPCLLLGCRRLFVLLVLWVAGLACVLRLEQILMLRILVHVLLRLARCVVKARRVISQCTPMLRLEELLCAAGIA
jgi:hypothetical protein